MINKLLNAVVIGGTGAVGTDITKQLNDNNNFLQILLFVRTAKKLEAPKVRQLKTDFNQLDKISILCKGDIAFSCLGSTRKKAGNKKNQYLVDFDYQLQFAQIAKKQNIDTFVLVSSKGASVNSSFFYPKMKGDLEEAIRILNFKKLIIARPSVLIRKNSDRFGEKIGVKFLSLLNKVGLFKLYKPIKTSDVAHRLIQAAIDLPKGIHVLENSDLFSE